MTSLKRARTTVDPLDEGVLTQFSNPETEEDPNSQMKLPDPYGHESQVFDDPIEPPDDLGWPLQLDPHTSYSAILMLSVDRIAFVKRARMQLAAVGYQAALDNMPKPCNHHSITTPDTCDYFKWHEDFIRTVWPRILVDASADVIHVRGDIPRVNITIQDMYIIKPCVCRVAKPHITPSL